MSARIGRSMLIGAAVALTVTSLHGQAAPLDSAVMRMLARIREEGLTRSQVLETALTLSDVYGPRLAGSAAYLRAAGWARDRLVGWGVTHAALEAWGRRGPGWQLERYSVEMTAPNYLRVNAVPRAWSLPTTGLVTGAPVGVNIQGDSDYARYQGKLHGAIVLDGAPRRMPDRFRPLAHRWTDAELDSLTRLTDPGSPHGYWEDYDEFVQGLAARKRRFTFFKTEGVAAVLVPSSSSETLRADGFWEYAPAVDSSVPTLVVAREHYSRLWHLVEHQASVRLELSLAAHFTPPDSGYDVVAEIPGSDPKLAPEVVMVGGHLDSWIGGTGATDNAAGSAVAMEALRILQAVGARPRRTVRLGLWDGEEPSADYSGSVGYVKRHYGDPATLKLLPEHARFDAYFNVDNGSGKIRGLFLQSDSAARPIFARMLEPLRDLGAVTLTIANTGSTDHISFVGVGLPGFEVIQDPLDYESRTHHSVLDVGDYLAEDDLKQAAVVMASLLYQTAMLDGKIPRTSMPAPRGK